MSEQCAERIASCLLVHIYIYINTCRYGCVRMRVHVFLPCLCVNVCDSQTERPSRTMSVCSPAQCVKPANKTNTKLAFEAPIRKE